MKENIAINEEMKGSNKLAVIGHSVVVLGVIVIYVMEYLKGVNGFGLTAFMIAYCITPAVIECVIYSKRPDHPAIKHLLGYGFPSFYVIMLITSSNPLAFTLAIATLILATAYADSAYIKKECIGTVLINIVNVILLYKKGVYGPDTSIAVATHIISMTIISVYFYMSTRRVEKNSLTQVERINVSANKTQSLLDNILEITKELNEEIADIHDLTGELGESIKETSSAMSEVNAGSTDTANAVQNQLVLTENIKNNINDVKSETSEIGKKVEETLEALRQGNKKIDDLLKESEAAVENGNDVTRKLTKLDEIMENMYSVVGIITDITSQTSLLSLNASIEAARAGEAGRGFAVVASEIQKMANDTQLAANQIKEMIDNVSNSITEVVEATKGILVNITDQAETTNLTAESFRIIETNTEDIAASSGSLSKSVEILETANNEIVDSISTISAISEEVTAHANDTFASSEKDSERIHHVIASADKLKELSKKLSV